QELSRTTIGPADGDLFYNAVYQGLNAIGQDLDIPRDGCSKALRCRIANPDGLAWELFYVTGGAGSGKSVLLDRIAFDALNNEFSVFKCQTAYVDPQTFYDRLRSALASARPRALVIFDDANRLELRGIGVDSLAALQPAQPGQTVTLVLAA